MALWPIVRIETGLASYPTARSKAGSCHFGRSFGLRQAWHLAQRLTRVSLRWMVRGGPDILPVGSLVSLRRWVRCGPGGLPDSSFVYHFGGWSTTRATTASRVRYGKEYTHTPDPPGCGPEPEATCPGRSNDRIPPNGVTDRTIPSAYSWVQVTTPRQPSATALGIIPSTGVLSVLTDILPIRPLPISHLDS